MLWEKEKDSISRLFIWEDDKIISIAFDKLSADATGKVSFWFFLRTSKLVLEERISRGRLICTGPYLGVKASLKASWNISDMLFVWLIVQVFLVIGSNNACWSISWKAFLPTCSEWIAPAIDMTGEKAADHILGRDLLSPSNVEPWINPNWKRSQR